MDNGSWSLGDRVALVFTQEESDRPDGVLESHVYIEWSDKLVMAWPDALDHDVALKFAERVNGRGQIPLDKWIKCRPNPADGKDTNLSRPYKNAYTFPPV